MILYYRNLFPIYKDLFGVGPRSAAGTEVLPAVVRALRDPEAARIEIEAPKEPASRKSGAAAC